MNLPSSIVHWGHVPCSAELFCIKHRDQRVFVILKLSYMFLSSSFEYLYYGSTTTINILMTFKIDPRAVRVYVVTSRNCIEESFLC